MRPRWLPNPFRAAGAMLPSVDVRELWERSAALLPLLEQSSELGIAPRSTGHGVQDPTIYTGIGGVAVAELRAGLHCRDVRGDVAEGFARLRTARKIARACIQLDPRSSQVSFFCGTPGYIAIACVASAELGEVDPARAALYELLDWTETALAHDEDELLFGCAGFIYCLQWVANRCPAPVSAQIGAQTHTEAPLRQLSEQLVARGQELARDHARRTGHRWPLLWHCFGEPYLGAAHGTVGVLASLYRSFPLLSAQSQRLVDETLQALLDARFDSGNLPILADVDARDEHVHWCHGAPGLPSLLAAAARARGDADGRLRAAAEKAAEVVWERGVLCKGNGLCHGLAGNGYTLLSLAQWPRSKADGVDEAAERRRWLGRAAAFGALLDDAEVQRAMAVAPDPQRRVRGVPDAPISLMEGSAGELCFCLDLAEPSKAAFPGWDL